MDLSIIIVNWHSAQYATKCIASIYAATHNLKFEILVVDNASSDDSCDVLEQTFPAIKLIRSPENIGFARANNLGFIHSSGRVLLFLNPDTELAGPAINFMVASLESSPAIGIMGCKLLNSDGSVQTSCIQPIPTVLNQVADVEWLKRRCPKLKLWGMAPLFAEDRDTPAEVEAVSGACLMVRREAFERVAFFDADYFMYMEDLDLCYKVREAGWKVCYAGRAKAIHHGGQSTKRAKENRFADVLVRECIWKFLRKTRGSSYAQFYRACMFGTAIVRLGILGLVFALPIPGTDRTSARVALNKWHGILRWSVGREKWTRHLGAPRKPDMALAKS